MNVFNSIYSTDIDSFDRDYIIAETTLTIDIERANKEYMLESGLLANSNEDTFFEATKKKSNQNAFSKLVQGICNGIRTFITSIGETISNMFSGNKLTSKDIQNRNEEIKIRKDLEELDKVTQKQINEGNKLLKRVSSSPNGLPDGIIKTWIETSTDKIAAVAPKYIKMGLALGLKEVIFGKLKKNKEGVKNTEDSAKSSGNETPKQQEQKRGILNHIFKLHRSSTNELYGAARDIDKSLRGDTKSELKTVEKKTKRTLSAIDEVTKGDLERYLMGIDDMSDSEFLSTIANYSSTVKSIKNQAEAERAEIINKAREKSAALKLFDITKNKINEDKSTDAREKTLYLAYIETQKKKYLSGVDTFDKYYAAMQYSAIKRG